MQVREANIQDKNQWNDFIRTQQMGSFLQSWEWSEFMATQKEKVWRLIVEDNGKWLAVIFLFKSNLKLGQNILYAPAGPVFADDIANRREAMQAIQNEIDKIAGRENIMAFQIDPPGNEKIMEQIFDDLGFQKSEDDIQPRHTLILDIRLPEEELLSQMQQKTRYNIRLAQKKGVSVIIDNAKFKAFYELQKQTMARQKFTYYPEEYYKKLLELPFVKLYLAKFEGKIVAANIMIFWNDTATYLFGASDYNARQIMAPHLLQWQAIKDAKQQGMWFYDFWGVGKPMMRINSHANVANKPKNKKEKRLEKWAGFTKFKMGFSPDAEITEYLGTYEKAYAPVKLGLYRFLRKVYKR
ncbi:MAG: peptidoglycan bridge formation glycyltransferase FemA/FemB family protein [Parcubacteria group bacterium]